MKITLLLSKQKCSALHHLFPFLCCKLRIEQQMNGSLRCRMAGLIWLLLLCLWTPFAFVSVGSNEWTVAQYSRSYHFVACLRLHFKCVLSLLYKNWRNRISFKCLGQRTNTRLRLLFISCSIEKRQWKNK